MVTHDDLVRVLVEVQTLRAAAAVLVTEPAEPCWGLAQGLSQIAERIATEAALPAGRCFACGQAAGQHEGWCIHAYEHATAGDSGADLDLDVWGGVICNLDF